MTGHPITSASGISSQAIKNLYFLPMNKVFYNNKRTCATVHVPTLTFLILKRFVDGRRLLRPPVIKSQKVVGPRWPKVYP